MSSPTALRHVIRFPTPPASARRSRRLRFGLLALAFALALAADPVAASSLYLNELSTASQGNAGVGRGAWAPDASVAIHNPASMTRLDDHGFAAGLSLVVGRVHFDPASNSPSGGGSGGNQFPPTLLPSFNYVHKASDRVRVGLSFFAEAGTGLNPSNNWAGRFEVTDISLAVLTISPTIAIEVTDWLSIGGGPTASYASLDWDLRVDALTDLGSERQAKLKELDDWQASGRVGALIQPLERLSLSVYYNAKTDFKLRGKTRLPAGLNPDISTELPFPQYVEVSAAFALNDRVTLLGTFNWEDWSEADKLKVGLGGRDVDAATGFKDTYKIGLGANYQLREDWLLQTGLMFDTSGLRNRTRTTALPVDQQIRFSVGFQHDLNDALTLGASFTYAHLGDAEVRTANVVGDYDANEFYGLGVTIAFKRLPWSGKLTF